MASRRNRPINLPAPYLRRVWLEPSRSPTARPIRSACRSCGDDFELSFDRAITIIVGENGTGKSTLLEGIAVLAGYDEAGGGKGYRPVDHSNAIEAMGGQLRSALRASWLPKVTNGWFFRAESFFSVARYLDEAAANAERTAAGLPVPFARRGLFALLRGALPAPGHLHLRRAGIRAVALAPDGIPEADAADGKSGHCQIIMATHSPMLMAYPGARLLRLTKYGLEPVTVEGDGSLQGHAGVLRGSGGVCRGGDGGVSGCGRRTSETHRHKWGRSRETRIENTSS